MDILHLPYTYFPNPPGGTEIYVADLIEGLRPHGFSSAVATPSPQEEVSEHDGVPVFGYAMGSGRSVAAAHGEPDSTAARSFAMLLARVRPKIIHLHARTAAVSERLVDAAHDAGCRVVFTYHTPTVSCSRGTMLRMGQWPCDGVLDRRRCTACVLEQHHVPPVVRDMLAWLPEAVGAGFGRTGLTGGAYTALRMGALIGAAQRRFHELMRKADRVVAVCGWVAEMLRANGVPDDKLVFCRQGLGSKPAPPLTPADRDVDHRGRLRLGYFGRLDAMKGPDLLVAALRRSPRATVRLVLYGVCQPGAEAYVEQLRQEAAADPRIELLPALPPEEVDAAMRQCDLIAVPSRCLETGPLVVLEAFGAGTPVLGAKLGGIAELVRDGIDGMLVAPDDPTAWAAAMAALAEAPERVTALRAGIRPPRTMAEVAGEMASLYRDVLADGAG